MDRNRWWVEGDRFFYVALRKESVDRNANPGSTTLTFPGSLSARRAWIEMLESKQIDPSVMSLSARRAWIEISKRMYYKA